MRGPLKKARPWNGKSPRKARDLSELARKILVFLDRNEVTIRHYCIEGSPLGGELVVIWLKGKIDSSLESRESVEELYYNGYITFCFPRSLKDADVGIYEITKLGRTLLKPSVKNERNRKSAKPRSFDVGEPVSF